MQGEEDTPTPPHLLPVLSELVYGLTIKGHSQLMHMRIKYHFLADFLSQDVCETKAYPEYSK